MDDDSKDFHDHFLSLGGYFDSSQTGFKEMYEFTLSEYLAKMQAYQKTSPKFPLVNVNYINNNNLNAVASKDKKTGKYYTGIYAGTFILLNELFLRMMASPNILKHVGNALIEGPT